MASPSPAPEQRDSSSLQALLRLSSASLPIGGYSYSQSLESAVALHRVCSLKDLGLWISSALQIWPRGDALLWALCFSALQNGDYERLAELNRRHWASRDTSELRNETEQMGWSLINLLAAIDWLEADLQAALMNLRNPTFLVAHASGCWSRGITLEDGLVSFCFVFVEGQVQAAQKLLPIGQAASQRLLSELQPDIDRCVQHTLQAFGAGDALLHTAAPMQSLLSARHEFQYSRLFRS